MDKMAVFTKNEAESMICKRAAEDLRLIASHVEEHNYSSEKIIEWLRELADQSEAQIVVIELRDKL